MAPYRRKQRAKRTRTYRIWHKRVGLALFVVFAIVSISGILLAYKDPMGLKPKTQNVALTNDWKSVEELLITAQTIVTDSLGLDATIDRLDIRPDIGVVKVLFKNHFTELQLSGMTAELLSVQTRSDHIIERIHDGSIIEFYTSQSDVSKWIFSTLSGIGLLGLVVTGLGLWYAPRSMKSKD